MKRKLPTGIFAAAIVAACMVSRAQTNIYTLSVGSYIINYPFDSFEQMNGWSSGSQPNSFGFCQWQKVHHTAPFYQGEAVPHSTYTVVYYGSHSLPLFAPAWVLGLGGVLLAGLLSWLTADAIGRMRE